MPSLHFIRYYLFLLLLLPTHARCQEQTDTIASPTRFVPGKLILPASLITAGSLALYINAFKSVNHQMRDEMAHLSKGHSCKADEWLRFLPAISYLGTGCFTTSHTHTFQERTAITATAFIAMGIMTKGAKELIHEERPDHSDSHSFPSGHTATAFMGAELVRMEYSTPHAIGAYTIATGVAFLRLYNQRHWIGDVIAGAGIGILSARIGYWLLPLNRKLFRLGTPEKSILLLPQFDTSTQTYGISLTAHFK